MQGVKAMLVLRSEQAQGLEIIWASRHAKLVCAGA